MTLDNPNLILTMTVSGGCETPMVGPTVSLPPLTNKNHSATRGDTGGGLVHEIFYPSDSLLPPFEKMVKKIGEVPPPQGEHPHCIKAVIWDNFFHAP